MINRVLCILWPRITVAGIRMALDIAKTQLKPMLEEVSRVACDCWLYHVCSVMEHKGLAWKEDFVRGGIGTGK
jgi:hypothetical protein